MALVVYDRVQETTATTGTGTITLGGAVSGYQSFAVVGNGNTTFYCILNGTAWEVGIGTYSTTGPTLARTTILSNSLGTTAPINLSGASNVFLTYPAEKSVNKDSSGTVNILTNVPNTSTTVGTLNVGDGTYNFAQLGQLATFASSEPIVNGVMIQNTSSSNTAYSSVQIGADNYNNGYFIELGTNSSTYSYSAAGYPNSSINQPNVNYILANKADLGIATWDNKNIHFIQNASVATTDSMTLYASGGVSLGGNPDPGLGTLYANNVYIGFTTVTAAAGTTVLTNSSSGWIQVVGTTTQTIQLPVATTLYKGLAYTVANNSTGAVTIKDSAGTTLDTTVTGGTSILVLTANSTSAGTWVAYSYIPSSYDFSNTTANFGNATITNAVWNGTTIGTGYGGTGLTTFTAANNAIYSTSSSALTAGTLPVAAGGTGATTLTGYVYGNGTSAMTASTTIPTSALSGNFVSTFSAGTTGLTPSTATTGAVTLAGTLGIGNGGTGITFFGTGVQTALGSAVTGSGGIVLATSPTLVTPALGTPSSGNFSTGTFTWPTFNQSTTGSAGSVANAVTFNNGGTGAASGTTYNGSAAQTISYNTVGAAPAGGSTSITSLGTVTAGTWNANVISATYGGTGIAGTLTGISYMNGTSAHTAATGTQISSALGSTAISGQAGSVANSLTINNSGTGSASGTTYNGSAAQTISYNSIGASPLAGSSSLTTTGTITSGTWNGSAVGVAYGGTGSTTLTANNVLLGNGTSALQVVAPGTSGNVLTSNGTTWVSTAASSSNPTITPTVTNTTYYITGTPNTSGSLATAYISSTNGVSYNASTGALTATSFSGAGTGLTGTASSLSIGGNAATATTATTATTANALNTSNTYQVAKLGIGKSPSNLLDILGPSSAGNNGAVITAYQASFQVLNNAQTQNWYFGVNDAASNALYIGRGYGPNQAITPSLQFSTGDIATFSSNVISNGGFQANSSAPFFLNATTVSASYTIPSGYNASSAGKVTINTGVTVTVSTGSRWVVV